MPPLVRAALLAYRAGFWEPEDILAVIDLVRGNRQLVPETSEPEAVKVMTRWLHVAKRLRLAGQPVTALAIAWSSGGDADERSAALNDEAREELERLGAKPPTEPIRPPRK